MNMELIGAQLKKIRLEKGLSLEEVQKKTKIHLNILQAIEEDNYINLNPVYVKGFLKIYCKFLGVDYNSLLSQSTVFTKVPQGDVISSGEKSASFLKEKPVVLAPSAPIKILMFILKIAVALIIIFAFISFGKFFLSKVSHLVTSVKTSIKSPVKKDKPEGKPVKTDKERARNQTLKKKLAESKSHKIQMSPSGIRLGISAKEDCWIKLSVDGKVIFQSVLKKGRTESWQAKDRIEFSLGNAGGVVLEVNGTIMPPLGRKGQAVNNVVLNKDGLKAE